VSGKDRMSDPSQSAEQPASSTRDLVRDHSRRWRNFQYVYPVISRRSEGLSIGINLSTDQICNFNCVYCQVKRTPPPARHPHVDLAVLKEELDSLLEQVLSDTFWQDGPFAGIDPSMRRLDNIAFSGDGEPTLCRWFEQAVAIAAASKIRLGLHDLKLVLITNASRLHDPGVVEALNLMAHYRGEIWAKLDAGSAAGYEALNRSRVPFSQILENLRETGLTHDLVLQTMLLRQHGQPLPDAEFEQYLACVEQLQREGCRLQGVQLYTVARSTAEDWVSALSADELEAFAARFRHRFPTVPVRVYDAG